MLACSVPVKIIYLSVFFNDSFYHRMVNEEKWKGCKRSGCNLQSVPAEILTWHLSQTDLKHYCFSDRD